MEVLGRKIGLTPEDKKIVIGYLSPYIKGYAIGKAKQAAGVIGPKVALKVVRKVDAKLEPTDYKKIKFVVAQAKKALEKPELEKLKAKEEKNKSKEEKKQARIEKKKAKKEDKLSKMRAKGKLTMKAKLVSNLVLAVGGRIC